MISRKRIRVTFVFLTASVAVVLVAGALLDASPGYLSPLVVLLAVAVLSEAWGISLYGDSRVSVSFAAVAAAALIEGFTGATLVAAAAGLSTVVHRRDPEKVAFNFGALTVAGAAMGAFCAATEPLLRDRFELLIAVSAALGSGLNFLINSFLIAIVVGVSSRRSPFAVWAEKFRWLILHYLVLGLLGAGLAEAFDLAGLPGLLLFLLPIGMQKVAMEQYVARTQADVSALRSSNAELTVAHEELTIVHGELSNLVHELKDTYDGTLLALVNALDARDADTRGHSERVARHTRALATLQGIRPDTEDGITIYRGALLHDIGKIGIADGILLKPGALTDKEFREMRRHPVIGRNMLADVPFLVGASEIILAHHEQWDGEGYPRGLRRDEIPIGARLFSVADCFDAMMSNRPYRRALRLDETVAELLKFRGTQFDPEAVDAFLQVVESWMAEYPDHPDFLSLAA